MTVKEHESEDLHQMVQILIEAGSSFADFDDFYFSYEIPQIGKEFDLIRVSESCVLNIELKHGNVSTEKIQKQLIRNRYYLNSLGRKTILVTYLFEENCFYRLNDDNELHEISVNEIAEIIKLRDRFFQGDLDQLFKVSDFLVSPLNTPDRFLAHEYFLTSQQEKIQKIILGQFPTDSPQFIGVTGGPGTGKTLLLYDLAARLSEMDNCCLIHCGVLSDGHVQINAALSQLNIIPAKDLRGEYDFSPYRIVFIDEAQRIYSSQFEKILTAAQEFNLSCIFSYDPNQVLSDGELRANVVEKIEGLDGYKKNELSGKIRTNRELVSFIRRLLDLKDPDIRHAYPSVNLFYANNTKEADELIHACQDDGYTFINFTKSSYKGGSFDRYIGDFNTHVVIGQEFDKVLMILDKTFQYDENGLLRARVHPNPNYLYRRLLFQGLTRVREKLALIIIDNPDLFDHILSLFS